LAKIKDELTVSQDAEVILRGNRIVMPNSLCGIPRVAKSENGPPFASEEIKVYMEEKGIKHSRITSSMATVEFRSRELNEASH